MHENYELLSILLEQGIDDLLLLLHVLLKKIEITSLEEGET